jgi:hypothetical protein
MKLPGYAIGYSRIGREHGSDGFSSGSKMSLACAARTCLKGTRTRIARSR